MIEKLKGRNLFLILGILTVTMGVVIRAVMLKNLGFFEPDVYFYYSVLRETIQNGFIVPTYSYLSGFPAHNHIGEAPGIIYMSAIPYFFLRYLGVSYYTVMRLVPILFGVLTMIGTWMLARRLSKSPVFGLLVLFLTAVSIGSLSRTAGTEYRGDTFIGVFILAALYLMLKGLEETGNVRKAYYAIALSGVVLSLGSVVWNGFPYTFLVYLGAVVLISLYAFIADREPLLKKGIVASLSLLLAYLLQHLYAYVDLSRLSLPLTGLDFFVIYLPVLAGLAAAYYALGSRQRFRFLSSSTNRLLAVIAFAAVALVLLSGQIISHYNAVFGHNAVGLTTLELQPTTLDFLARVFNMQILLAPLGFLFFLLLSSYAEDNEHRKVGKLHLNISPAFLSIVSYIIVTGILQGSAVRFNAVFAVPMAIFAAYCLFLPLALFRKHANAIRSGRMLRTASALALGASLLVCLYITSPLSIPGSYFIVGIVARIVSVGAIVFAIGYIAYGYARNREFAAQAYACLVAVLLIYGFYSAYIAAATSHPADGINGRLLEAMQWMRNNTPTNATVAAVWTDGSVVEGWANRTSYLDSVGGENGTKIAPFNRWLFNTSNATDFLYSIGKPDYLVSRTFWYAELQGLFFEAGLTNVTPYSYQTLTDLNRTIINNTVYYRFSSGNNTSGYRAELVVAPQSNQTTRFAAFIGTVSSDTLVLIRNVVFYNTQNFNYSIATSNVTNSLNYTLLVTYKNNEIVGGTIVGPELYKSNFFKFTVLCNAYVCPADTSNVTYDAVYLNNDTKIFKIDYK
ncbi:MAG: glycosyltransferase family 39 protein [Candidatus Micrarchaeota archaeon]|nr:glycosyltransferase family 39 protein [Candidatus Micrarchaeota archaeon]